MHTYLRFLVVLALSPACGTKPTAALSLQDNATEAYSRVVLTQSGSVTPLTNAHIVSAQAADGSNPFVSFGFSDATIDLCSASVPPTLQKNKHFFGFDVEFDPSIGAKAWLARPQNVVAWFPAMLTTSDDDVDCFEKGTYIKATNLKQASGINLSPAGSDGQSVGGDISFTLPDGSSIAGSFQVSFCPGAQQADTSSDTTQIKCVP